MRNYKKYLIGILEWIKKYILKNIGWDYKNIGSTRVRCLEKKSIEILKCEKITTKNRINEQSLGRIFKKSNILTYT